MIVKELAARLGLEIDEATFEAGEALMAGLKTSLIGIVGGAVAVVGGLLEMGRETANAGFEASKLAQRMGVTTDAAQELAYAAETTGTSAEALQSSIFHMSREIEAAKEGSIEAQRALAGLGVPLNELYKLKPDEQFTRLAGGLSKVDDQGRKAQKGQAIFGRGVRELAPLMAAGEEGIRSFREEAHEMGLVLSEETIKESKEWRLEMRHAAEQIDALKFKVGAFVLHGLRAMTKAWQDFKKEHGEQILFIIRGALILLTAATVAYGLAHATAIGEAIAGWVALGLTSARTGLTMAAAWLESIAPIAAATVGVIALGLAVDELYHFFKGDKATLMGKVIELWKENVHSVADAFAAILGTIKEIANNITGGALDGLDKRADTIQGQITSDQAERRRQQRAGVAGHEVTLNNGKTSWQTDVPASTPTVLNNGMTFPATAPTFNASISIVQQPGQDAKDLAGHVMTKLEEFHRSKVREARAHAE